MPNPPRTEVLPVPNGSYAKPNRGPKSRQLIGLPPRGRPTKRRDTLGSEAAGMRPLAAGGNPEPRIAIPFQGSPVLGTRAPVEGETTGALAGLKRDGRNVVKLPKAL